MRRRYWGEEEEREEKWGALGVQLGGKEGNGEES